MKLLIVAFAGIAASASAKQDTDYPHRDWGQVATIDMTATEAAACLTRQLSRQFGRVTPVPAEGGTDIEGGPGGGFFGTPHDPWVSYQVRGQASGSTLRVFYRHPISQGNISRDVRRMGEKCLKIAKLSPA
jgi:hypothetical protein